MRVALVKAYEIEGPADQGMLDSFTSNIRQHQPDVHIDLFRPLVDDADLPVPTEYDLVVITGGMNNLLEKPFPVWVDKVLGMIRAVPSSNAKLLGVCWGHQAIACALSGTLEMFSVTRVGVEKIQLTSEGSQFFNKDDLQLTKFHIRAVSEPAPGFRPLALNNEILISDSNQILSLQGHPEIHGELSRDIFDGNIEYYGKALGGEEQIRKYYAEMPLGEADGNLVFEKVMAWAAS